MIRPNRDSVVALLLLLLTGVFYHQSYEIRVASYATLPAASWPRAILLMLGVLSLVYLVQSLRGWVTPAELDLLRESDPTGGGPAGAMRRYLNPLICFGLFFLFLLTLPYLGMLVGGILFVFLSLSALGPLNWRAAGLHLAIAVVSVAGIWAIFTYALRVFLPAGEWFS